MRKNEIDFMLEKTLRSYEDISDIIFTVGRPIQVISSGILRPIEFEEIPIVNLTPFQTEIFALNIIQGNANLTHQLITTGSCDCSYQLMDFERFRVNIFSQRGLYSIVLRKLSTEIPTISRLQLPTILQQIPLEKNGLILVTGATGSGKSSTLAAMIDEINSTQKVHIITLEDPIEFDHPHKMATVNQRELGLDFYTFPQGLRAALRQTPKVILVGEMRDKETFEIVLTAAETGHLVFSTLHTNDTGQSISRISAMFEKSEQALVRNRLAESLRWIIGQRLVPKAGGGRVAALEIMRNTSRITEIVVNGETEDKTFYDTIAQGSQYGMITFDQSLGSLYGKNIISENTAKTYCTRRSVMTREVDKVNAERGVISGVHSPIGSITKKIQSPLVNHAGPVGQKKPPSQRAQAPTIGNSSMRLKPKPSTESSTQQQSSTGILKRSLSQRKDTSKLQSHLPKGFANFNKKDNQKSTPFDLKNLKMENEDSDG